MPRGQRRSPSGQSAPQRYAIPGRRVGTQIYTVAGFFTNGSTASPAIIDALRQMRYDPQPLVGDPQEHQPSAQERADIEAANRLLGLDLLEDGRTRLQHEIDKGMRDYTVRLRKASYF